MTGALDWAFAGASDLAAWAAGGDAAGVEACVGAMACWFAGCSGAPGCGICGPLLRGISNCERASSARLIVYDLNGGSSEELLAAAGAGRAGPVNSSGTNSTIRATRMIAPVSRSFTR